MPNEPQDIPIAQESIERKHEVSEKSVRNPLMVAGAAWFLLVFGILASGGAFYFLTQRRPVQNWEPLGLIIAPNLKPFERFPKPELQIDEDHGQRIALDATQQSQLNSYGWVNRSNGIVRIPIDRAMDLILQRGLPTRTNNTSKTDGSTLQLIQNIPKEKNE